MRVWYHPQFAKSYRKLPSSVQRKAEMVEGLFRADPFTPRLKTHKLHGKFKHQWGFSIDKTYRIVFEFLDSGVVFLDVGDHDIYQ